MLILATQNKPTIAGKTKRLLQGGLPYSGAKKLPVCPKINDVPAPHLNQNETNRKMAKIQPEITPNFRTKRDGFSPHFSIQMGLQGNSKKVNNFGLHREERNDRYGSSGLLLLIPKTGKTFPFMRVHPLSSSCLVNLYLEFTIRNRP